MPRLILLFLFFLAFLPQNSFALQQYGEACDSRSPCAVGLTCNNGRCIYSCTLKAPLCPNHERCIPRMNKLSACYCRIDKDCLGPHMKCLKGRCAGTQSLGEPCNNANLFCDAGLICAQAKPSVPSKCYPLCSGTRCKTGEPCRRMGTFGYCYCSSDADCKDGTCHAGICHPKSGLGEECARDQPCRSGFICTKLPSGKSVCLVPCPGNICLSGERCVVQSNHRVCYCSTQNPCPNGTPCLNGVCQIGIRCDRSKPCPNRQICYYPLTTLKQGICINTCRPSNPSTCSNKTPCQPLSGGKYACYCKKNSECSTGICQNYQCIKPCHDDDQCPKGFFCNSNGQCTKGNRSEIVPDLPDGLMMPEDVPELPTDVEVSWAEGFFEPPKDGMALEGSLPEGGESNFPEGKERETKPIKEKKKPSCSPPCQPPLRCIDGKCSKAPLGASCESSEECASNLCFGWENMKICTTSDCNHCGATMKCQTIKGKTACYFGRTTPKFKEPEPKACSCQAGDDISWTIWFLFFLFFLLKSSLHRTPR